MAATVCNVYLDLPLLKIALVLVRFRHVASVIVNANHGIMRAAEKLCVANLRCWLRLARHTRDHRMAAHRRLDQRRVYLCGVALRKRAQNAAWSFFSDCEPPYWMSGLWT